MGYEQFLLGTLGTAFLQIKLADGTYLKDLLEGSVFPALEQYNATQEAITRMLVYKFDDINTTKNKLYSSDEFEELGDLQRPGTRVNFDKWDRAIPIRRFGAGTKITLEQLKQMTSQEIVEWHNAKLVADRKKVIRTVFESALTKVPTARVDALTKVAVTPKSFWNDEASMDTPRSNGQITFDGDHQHYIAVSSAGSIGTNGSELTTLLSLVTEHEGMDGQMLLFARQGTTVELIKAESTNFREINVTPSVVTNVGVDYSTGGFVQALITGSVSLGPGLKVVGTWKEALVIECVDIPAGYIFAVCLLGENNPESALGWREHPSFKGLMMVNENGDNVIIGKDSQYRRYLGLNVWNRCAGAVLYTTATTWAEPTFTG